MKSKIILIILLLGIFQLGIVSAWEFDNVKQYDESARTIHIKDSILSIPTTSVADIKLHTPDHMIVWVGDEVQIANFTFNVKEKDYIDWLKKIEFYDLNNGGQEIQKNVKYKYLSNQDIEVPEYQTVCSDIIGNGTIKCSPEKTGKNKIVNKPVWIDLDISKPLESDKDITIGIFTDVEEGEHTEWIITLFGKRLDEWTDFVGRVKLEYAEGVTQFVTAVSQVNGWRGQSFRMGTLSSGSYALAGIAINMTTTVGSNVNLTIVIRQTNSSGYPLNASGGTDAPFQNLTVMSINVSSLTTPNFYSVVNISASPTSQITLTAFQNYSIMAFSNGGTTSFTQNSTGVYAGGQDWVGNNPAESAAGDDHWNPQSPLGMDWYFQVWGINPNNAPNVTLQTPANNTNYQSVTQNVSFNCTVTDDIQVSNITLMLDGERNYTLSGLAGNRSELFLGKVVEEGRHLWTCLAVDNQSVTDMPINRTFLIDATKPYINITLPLNKTYNSVQTALNITAIDAIEINKCWYSTNLGVTNNSITCGTNVTGLSSGQGQSTWLAWANDTIGNENMSSVTFFVDSINPLVTIAYPVNTTYNINVSALNYSVSDTNIASCWYSLDLGVTNTSVTCGTNVTGLSSVEGTNIWRVYVNDTIGNTNFSSVTFAKDTVPPIVNIIYPINGTIVANPATLFQVGLNASQSDLNGFSNCFYYNDTTNVSITCNANTTVVLPYGNHIFRYYANDSYGNLAFNETIFNVLVANQSTNKPIVGEGDTATFTLNLNYTNIPTSTALLIYNGATFSPTTTNANTNSYSFLRTITIPIGIGNSSGVSIPWYWLYNITGIINSSTSQSNQTVLSFSIDNCTLNNVPILNFTLYDEDARTTAINNVSQNGTIEVVARIYTASNISTIATFNGSFSSAGQARVCMASNILNTSSYKMDYQTKYYAGGYATESKYGQNITVNNNTIPNNIGLYDLISTNSQVFQLNFKGSDLAPLQGAVIDILRQYIPINQYISVESPLTDSQGNIISHLVVSDVLYNINVYQYGVLVGSFNGYVAKCSNQVIGDCSSNFNLLTGDVNVNNFATYGNIQYYTSFNQSTRILSIQYNTIDGTIQNITQNVLVRDNFGNNTICGTSQVASSGTISCNIPLTYGNATVTQNILVNSVVADTSWISLADSAVNIFGGTRVILGALMYSTIVLMFISSPITIILGAILGVILASAFSFVDGGTLIGTGSIILYFIVAGGIIIWQMSRRFQ